MPLPINVLSRVALATALGLGLTSLAATTTLAQTVDTDIADEDVANLLEDNDCVILAENGLILGDNEDADTDGDGRAERFCTPARVDSLVENELLSELNMLTQTDYDDDGEETADENLIIDINKIRSVREVTPGNYVIVISKTGVVNNANVIDLVDISEDEATALLNEIERSRTVVIERQEEPEPLQIQPEPAPAPAPAPAPQVRPAPPESVPALW